MRTLTRAIARAHVSYWLASFPVVNLAHLNLVNNPAAHRYCTRSAFATN